MANTYTKLISYTVPSSTNSITISSIPSTYTHLDIRLSMFEANNSDTFRFRFNGDTGSNYTSARVYGSGTSTGADQGITNGTYFGDYLTTNTSPLATTTSLFIPNYAGSTYKSVAINHEVETGNSATNYIQVMSAIWNNTAAINSITIFVASYTISVGSEITIYGL